MPAPVLAAPLVIPFAEAIGVSIAALGMAKATDKVNEFIQENPEQSIKIFQMIMPSQGIANILKNESSEGDEDMDEEVEVEKDTRSKKEIVLEGVRRAREGRGNYSSPDATGSAVSGRGNVIRGLEDAGKIRKGPNPNYDASKKYQGYKRFIRPKKADGGAIGIEVLLEEENPRQGLFMGGSPLTGQALSIYNSMNAYGFDDQAIADALLAQGLYTPVSSTPDTPDTPQIASPRNIINQGGGGDRLPSGPTFNRNDLLGTPDYFPAEPFSFKDTISDIGDYIKGGGIIGAGIRGLKGLFSRNTKNYVTTPQIKARDRVEAERIAREEAARQEAIRQEAYAQARQDRETYRDLEASITSGQGGQGFDRPSSGPTATGAGMGVGGGYASDYGFKDGGLAAMFKKKR
jgi:hypothetical protein